MRAGVSGLSIPSVGDDGHPAEKYRHYQSGTISLAWVAQCFRQRREMKRLSTDRNCHSDLLVLAMVVGLANYHPCRLAGGEDI
jgi:hypothetical protein